MKMETVKIVNGYKIERTPGTQRYYYVFLSERMFVTFHSIKKAEEFIKTI